jgi:hypothetical protein
MFEFKIREFVRAGFHCINIVHENRRQKGANVLSNDRAFAGNVEVSIFYLAV